MAAVLDYPLQPFVIHPRCVEDDVDTRLGSVTNPFRSARVSDDLAPEAMRLGYHRGGLFLGESRAEAGGGIHGIAVHRDLDEIDAVLDLASNLLDTFGGVAHQDANRRTRYSYPAWIPVRQALARCDLAPGRGYSRTYEQAGFDSVANRRSDEAGCSRVCDRRITRHQDFLRRFHSTQRPILDGRVKVDVFFSLRVAVRKMNVDVD